MSEDTEEVEMEICVEETMVEGPHLEWLMQQVKERADLVQGHSPNQFLELVCCKAQHGHGTNAGLDLQRLPTCRTILPHKGHSAALTECLQVAKKGAATMEEGMGLESDGLKPEQKADVLLQPLEEDVNGSYTVRNK